MEKVQNTVPGADLTVTASDNKKLGAFIASTIVKYNTMAVVLHQAACMTLFHVAEFGECHALNKFYRGLRVNDQTALRVWFGKHATYADGDVEKAWISFSQKSKEDGLPGFSMIKGKLEKSKDRYALSEVKGKLNLLDLPSFQMQDVRDPSVMTYEKLLQIMVKAITKADAESDKTGIAIPADVKDKATALLAAATKAIDMAKVAGQPVNSNLN